MKLMPASRALATMRADVASSVGPPNIMVPRQIGEIFRPLRPRLRYCMAWVLHIRSICSLSPHLRGEGWGEGPLSEQRPSRDLYPLTRSAKGASTSPRKRGEVRNLTLTLQYLEHTARHRDTAFVD